MTELTPRQQITARARKLIEANALCLDTETTGLDESAEMCEIAITDAAGFIEFSHLIKPTKPIPQGAIDVHGITNEMVANAPTWREIQPLVIEIIRARIVLAYNADYDSRILRQSSLISGVAVAGFEWGCLMKAWCQFRGVTKWQKLDNVCREIEYPLVNAHRAMADAKAARAVLEYLAKQES